MAMLECNSTAKKRLKNFLKKLLTNQNSDDRIVYVAVEKQQQRTLTNKQQCNPETIQNNESWELISEKEKPLKK